MSPTMQQILEEFDKKYSPREDPTFSTATEAMIYQHEEESRMALKKYIHACCIRYAQGIVPKPMLHSESGDTISEKGMGYQKCTQDILCKLQEDTDFLNNE